MKKKMIAIVLFFTLLLNLTACGNSQKDVYEQNRGQTDAEDGTGAGDMDTDGKSDAGDGGGQEIEQKPEPVKKELSGELTVKIPNAFGEKKLADEFMKLYPQVKVICLESGKMNMEPADFLDFEKELAVELMSGNAADIIAANYIDYSKVGKNGLLCDLYELMERDDEFQKTDYFTNVFDALEVEGKLYGIPRGFSMTMVWLCKSVTNVLDLDMSQYTEVTGKQIMDMFDEVKASGNLPTGFVQDQCGPGQLLSLEQRYHFDRITKNVQFNTPEYVDFLNRLKMFEKPATGWGMGSGISGNVFPDAKDSFVSPLFLDGRYYAQLGMENEQWNCPVAYVSEDGKQSFDAGLLAISSSSPNKELAWEFIKYCISEKDPADYGDSNSYAGNFVSGVPINRANCRNLAECMSPDGVDEAAYERYVKFAESCNFHSPFSFSLNEAWQGATTDFLDKGLITAEDCAKLLQERTETYFKE